MFYDMYYLGEQIYEWQLGPEHRRVPHAVPYHMLSTRSIRVEQAVAVARRGTVATRLLTNFEPSAYLAFVRTQLLVRVPPPRHINPLADIGELGHDVPADRRHGKCVRRSFEPRAPNTAVIVGMPKHRPSASFSFTLDHTGEIVQGMLDTTHVSPYQLTPPDYTHVLVAQYNELSQLYEAARLSLATLRLTDEQASMLGVGVAIGHAHGSSSGGQARRGVGRRQHVVTDVEESNKEEEEEGEGFDDEATE